MRQILLDTETTGLSPAMGDRVVEIGCVELLNRKLTEAQFHVYLNPERDMPDEAFRIHGLSNEFLADKPKFADIANEFLAFIAGAELIIHNASFDLGFLDAELARLDLAPVRQGVGKVIDTVSMARNLFPGKRASLDALCDRFDIDRSGRDLHGALLDAQLLSEVYIALTRGQDSLLAEPTAKTNSNMQTKPKSVVPAIDLAVIYPSADELVEHEKVLLSIDQSSKGKTVWRGLV